MASVTGHAAVSVPIHGGALEGDLSVPPSANGVIVFAHGSGSSRHSPRNRHVAEVLNRHSLATVLVDLLTPDEDEEDQVTRRLRFDIDLLANRLVEVTDWVAAEAQLSQKKIGCFGASTGAAAALIAAARRPNTVTAVVSRGGRPDLAGPALRQVRAPTLLIVGGRDSMVLELNQKAMAGMACEVELKIIPGATHLFEEPGALENVAKLAAGWFETHLK
jgi:dienelactone hydrolase